MNHKLLLRKAHALGIRHGFINYWVGALLETLEEPNSDRVVAEFGGFGAEFLRLVYLMAPYRHGLISTLSNDEAESIRKRVKLDSPLTVNVVHHSDVGLRPVPYVDIGYAFEVFSLVNDLHDFALTCAQLLGDEGVMYATFAWHESNPLSERTREIRLMNKRPFFLYSLDDVVSAYVNAGFEVGVKRLPLPYFLVCDPNTVAQRYGSVESMIRHGQEQVYLFSFRKQRDR